MSSQEEHPGFERLLQFVDGELTAPEFDAVANHLTGCRDCSKSAEQVQRVVRALSSGLRHQPSRRDLEVAVQAFRQSGLGRRPVGLFGRLTWDSFAMGLAPGLRSGASEVHQLLYTTEAADLDLSVSDTGDGNRTVIGQALPKSAADALGQAQVLLISAEQIVAHASTTTLGEFSLTDVPAGNYTLVVLTPDVRLEVSEVPL